MSTGVSQTGGGAGGPAQLQIDHVRVSKTRTRLTARLGDGLIHRDDLNVNSATARGRFAEKVAEKTGFDHEEIEDQLLAIAAELAELYGDADEGQGPQPYHLVHDHEDPEQRGLYCGPMQLANATLEVIEDLRVDDDIESRRRFQCRATLGDTTTDFTISAEDFASNVRLLEVIYAALGAKLRILCKPHALRTAVSAVSDPVGRRVTPNFGWTKEGDAYFTPSVRIDAIGIHPVGDDAPLRVDLADEQCARHLDMAAPRPWELPRLKKHLVGSFLPLHARRVTYTLIAAAALAVLIRFVPGMNRPGLWLVGRTGGGKSYLARLVMNLFGDFPLAEGGRLGSWSSTPNFLQRQGYFFRDSLYLVDDFKPEVTRHPEVLKLLQNYADGSGRGRLKADATANVTRPIRGILVSTGEDTPEHSSSAVARNVIIPVPSAAKDLKRGRRCLRRCGRYRVVMAAFVRHLIAHGRTVQFAKRVAAEVQFFYSGIEGEQNDIRIAGNFALLAAAFREFAAFLGDAWPGWQYEAEAYITQDLLAIRDEMLAAARQQQASEVFLTSVRALLLNGRVRITGWYPPDATPEEVANKPVVGRRVPATSPAIASALGTVFDISTRLALEAVQELLRRQAKPPLALTDKALIEQLAGAGKLLDKDSQPIPPDSGGDHTWASKVAGATKNVFRIRASDLIGEPPPTHQEAAGQAQQAAGGQAEGGSP
jgi:hypothetical protein